MKKLLISVLCLILLLSPALAADDAPVTRGQFVTGIWELWGGVPYEDTRVFADVDHDRSDTTAICWAYDLGLVQGTGGGLFAPDRPITREEAAVLLRRAADYLGRETATSSNLAECNDYDGISPWADDSLYWATEIRLIDWAPGGLMAPGETISPGEFSGILERFA